MMADGPFNTRTPSHSTIFQMKYFRFFSFAPIKKKKTNKRNLKQCDEAKRPIKNVPMVVGDAMLTGWAIWCESILLMLLLLFGGKQFLALLFGCGVLTASLLPPTDWLACWKYEDMLPVKTDRSVATDDELLVGGAGGGNIWLVRHIMGRHNDISWLSCFEFEWSQMNTLHHSLYKRRTLKTYTVVERVIFGGCGRLNGRFSHVSIQQRHLVVADGRGHANHLGIHIPTMFCLNVFGLKSNMDRTNLKFTCEVRVLIVCDSFLVQHVSIVSIRVLRDTREVWRFLPVRFVSPHWRCHALETKFLKLLSFWIFLPPSDKRGGI